MPLVPGVKITVPQLPLEFVVRSELVAELDAGAAADVVLVCAPAGYGKSLLLADWSRTSTAADTAWVGVDRDDNDPQRLWPAVVAAVAGCSSVPQHSRLHDPRAWQRGARPGFIGEFADTLQALPLPIRLILDTFTSWATRSSCTACSPSCGSNLPPSSSCSPAGSIRRCPFPSCVWRAS
jgi:LuxR family maltose regulon positive regulatory protein